MLDTYWDGIPICQLFTKIEKKNCYSCKGDKKKNQYRKSCLASVGEINWITCGSCYKKKREEKKMFAPYDDDGSHLNVIGYFSHTYIGSEDVAECG